VIARRRGLGWTALLLASAYLLHQLRYALAGVPDAGAGHGYLAAAIPAAIALAVIAASDLAARLAAAARSGLAQDPAPGALVLWWHASITLLAAYCAQETAEGLLSSRSDWLWRSFGARPLLPLLLAVAMGALVALLTRAGDAAVASVAGRAGAPPRRRRPTSPPRPEDARPARTPALAAYLAGRGPPLTSE
jgi:hypothetical protein